GPAGAGRGAGALAALAGPARPGGPRRPHRRPCRRPRPGLLAVCRLLAGPGPAGALRARLGAADGDELWDRLVEVRAAGGEPEAVRRAALLAGWALRAD